MEENKFFKLVWRFNGLLISIAGILAVCVLVFVAFKLVRDITSERNTRNVINVSANAEVKENWRLGKFIEINDKQVLMIPLYSDQSFDRAYYSKSTKSIRNYLFIDTSDYSQNWIFDKSENLITRSELLRLGDYNSASPNPVVAILYELVQQDTDNDVRLSAQDISTIAISNPSGSSFKVLIEEVDSIVDFSLLSESELFLVYQKGGVSYSSVLNVTNGEVVKTTKLTMTD